MSDNGLCVWCGWHPRTKPLVKQFDENGARIIDQVQRACRSNTEAEGCALNKENVRKYKLRFRDEPPPSLVRSVRHASEKKGEDYEWLLRVE